MTFARLLTAAVLVCAAPSLAQNQRVLASPAPGSIHRDPGVVTIFTCCAAAATPAEPWRIVPNQAADAGKNPLDRLPNYDYKFFHLKDAGQAHVLRPNADEGMFDSGLEPQLNADATCYSIRSYVVARDAKDSDSTHPAGYSTCLSSDRYHVKSAEIRLDSPSH
jgi:hypothetical protein